MNVGELRRAARIIAAGGIVAYPTESVYGLGCDPRRHDAVRRLRQLKHRAPDTGLILIAAREAQLLAYVDLDRAPGIERARATWPGPYTWLLRAREDVSPWLRGNHETLAVRVTAHAGAAALCRHARSALVSTSANRHGRPPARSAAAVLREFGSSVDFILQGRLGGLPTPTEIRDAASGTLVRGTQ
jgi:L-threonylcarbamoyladenylate synthase